MTPHFRMRPILDAWRALLIFVVLLVISLVMLGDGRVWFDRLAGLPEADELLLVGLTTGNASWTEAALRRGASPNARDRFGNTPLMWAARSGDQQMVRRLIAAGADVSAKSGIMTPLSAAAMGGQLEVVEILLHAGADVDQRTIFERAALHEAAAGSHEMTIALLLKHGAAVDARSHKGRTPLLIATDCAEEAAFPCMRRLVDAGANVNAADAQGTTALMAAAEAGREQLVTLLLEAGADTASRDSRQRTAAMLARGVGRDALAARLEPGRSTEVGPPGVALKQVYGPQRAE